MLRYFYCAVFCMIHIIGPINVCTDFEINTYDRYFDQEQFETNQKSLCLPIQKLWLKKWF